MKLKDYAKAKRGNAAKLAKEIGVLLPVMYDWVNEKRPIPAYWCFPIEKATHGLVTRPDLRPNDWRDIWPELESETA